MLKENVSLKKYTTFQIGGAARYFWEAKSVDDLKSAIEWAQNKGLPFFVLAGGSNLLAADQGFDGLAIKTKNEKRKTKNENAKSRIIHCEAGVKLSDLVKLSLDEGLSGLEWAAGIPQATVGGAIWGNAGAFGKNIADIVGEV
ncbi:MAG: FAD-binding protein, partial [Patescibacteria group bacterium]